MLSLICAVVGLVFFLKKRVTIAGFRAAGPLVRRAGIVLIVPMLVGFITGVITLIVNMDQISAQFATVNDANVDAVLQSVLDLFWLASALEFMAILVALPTSVILIWSARGNNPQPVVRQQAAPPYEVDLPRPSESTAPQSGSVPLRATQPANFPLVLTVDEAAQMLQVSSGDVMRLIDDGRLPAARLGSGFRIARAAVEDYMAGEI